MVVGLTAAVPLATLAPWLTQDPAATASALRANQGVAGFGGPSALVQPALTRNWIDFARAVEPHALNDVLTELQSPLVLVGALVAAFAAWRWRATPSASAALVFCGVWVANPNWSYHYLVWGLPFLVLAGRMSAAVWLQAAALPPMAILYFRPLPSVTSTVFVVATIGLYLGVVAFTAWFARDLAQVPPSAARTSSAASSARRMA